MESRTIEEIIMTTLFENERIINRIENRIGITTIIVGIGLLATTAVVFIKCKTYTKRELKRIDGKIFDINQKEDKAGKEYWKLNKDIKKLENQILETTDENLKISLEKKLRNLEYEQEMIDRERDELSLISGILHDYRKELLKEMIIKEKQNK